MIKRRMRVQNSRQGDTIFRRPFTFPKVVRTTPYRFSLRAEPNFAPCITRTCMKEIRYIHFSLSSNPAQGYQGLQDGLLKDDLPSQQSHSHYQGWSLIKMLLLFKSSVIYPNPIIVIEPPVLSPFAQIRNLPIEQRTA